MLRHDLIDLHRVAQDGTRVRASAGASSFRRGETLERLMVEAKEHLAELTRGADAASTARRAAAQKRAAEDRLARLEQALAELPAVAKTKKKSGAKVPRRACRRPTPKPV